MNKISLNRMKTAQFSKYVQQYNELTMPNIFLLNDKIADKFINRYKTCLLFYYL